MEELLSIYRKSRKILFVIGIFHLILIIITLSTLYDINLRGSEPILNSSYKLILMSSSALGLLGSLLFFSRKVYTYLIADKFRALISSCDYESYKSKLLGYYIYLTVRPVAGIIIGPLLFMFVHAGLTTFSKVDTSSQITLSSAGMYLIYVISFVGGYSSSDLFDYLSDLGSKLIKKIELK